WSSLFWSSLLRRRFFSGCGSFYLFDKCVWHLCLYYLLHFLQRQCGCFFRCKLAVAPPAQLQHFVTNPDIGAAAAIFDGYFFGRPLLYIAVGLFVQFFQYQLLAVFLRQLVEVVGTGD